MTPDQLQDRIRRAGRQVRPYRLPGGRTCVAVTVQHPADLFALGQVLMDVPAPLVSLAGLQLAVFWPDHEIKDPR